MSLNLSSPKIDEFLPESAFSDASRGLALALGLALLVDPLRNCLPVYHFAPGRPSAPRLAPRSSPVYGLAERGSLSMEKNLFGLPYATPPYFRKC
jgi:hypothetical protein